MAFPCRCGGGIAPSGPAAAAKKWGRTTAPSAHGSPEAWEDLATEGGGEAVRCGRSAIVLHITRLANVDLIILARVSMVNPYTCSL